MVDGAFPQLEQYYIYAIVENSRSIGNAANMFTTWGAISQFLAYSQLAKAGNELEEEYIW